MAATTVNVQMQQRRDTAAGWTSANPTLLNGELGFETDTYKYKLGDGSTAWNSLAYASATGGAGVILESQQTIGADYTLTTDYNGVSAGTVAVSSGVTVTVPANAVWAIV